MRYLLIGLGNIGTKRLVLLGDRCVATVDPHNSAAQFKDLRECKKPYDAVILSVPNQAKIELLRMCLQLGKHVLVDKPLLFPSRDVAEELEKLAQENNVIWQTSYNHRFEPLILTLKEELNKGTIGKIYHGRFFYGNGTVSNLAGAWREEGYGVVEDLGSHLLDFLSTLLNLRGVEIVANGLHRNESKTFDHCLMSTKDGRFHMEATFTSWKNNCEIDLFGEDGSLHLRGLRKWGGSELLIRKRVRPSGVPQETRLESVGNDISWEHDEKQFEKQTQKKQTSMENDWWISDSLQRVIRS